LQGAGLKCSLLFNSKIKAGSSGVTH